MAFDLLESRLTHIDQGQTNTVTAADLVRRSWDRAGHDNPPPLPRRLPSADGPGGRSEPQVSVAAVPAGGPCHSARLHSVVHVDARIPSAPEPAPLKARNMAETITGHIKEFSSLNLSKHRSVINAFVHIIAAITAYQINGLG
jgi:hypothetical protein